jgi:aminomethyltransferase
VASDLLSHVAGRGVLDIGRFRFATHEVAGVPTMVSNTGYTGSPGYELYLPASEAGELFERLIDDGRELGVVPAGLGARDTLRLEAALPLYGHELDDETSPLAAGLDRFVKRRRGGFIGAEAIEERAAAGYRQVLVGFELEDRGVARAGYPVLREGQNIGRVTSGAPSPTLGRSIGLAYVRPDASAEGAALAIGVRNRELAARVVATPFVTLETQPTEK